MLPATTTLEEDRHTAGQRRINVIWELTQSIIALITVCAVLYAAVLLALRADATAAAFLFLTNVAFTIIGFYFGRTNHQRVGGVDLGR